MCRIFALSSHRCLRAQEWTGNGSRRDVCFLAHNFLGTHFSYSHIKTIDVEKCLVECWRNNYFTLFQRNSLFTCLKYPPICENLLKNPEFFDFLACTVPLVSVLNKRAIRKKAQYGHSGTSNFLANGNGY